MSDARTEKLPEDTGIEVHFDEKHGVLSLSAGGESFSRLRNLVAAEAGWPKAVDCIRLISIEDALRRKKTNWVRDRVGLIGCSIVGSLLGFALIVGVRTIVNWMR